MPCPYTDEEVDLSLQVLLEGHFVFPHIKAAMGFERM
jgi:hypothetical protein